MCGAKGVRALSAALARVRGHCRHSGGPAICQIRKQIGGIATAGVTAAAAAAVGAVRVE